MANNEQYASNLITTKMFADVNTLDYKSCWLWNGTTRQEGYGYAVRMINKKTYLAQIHRVSWYLLYGNIPEGKVIDHTCHDPSTCINGNKCEHRRCYNPYHLKLTTLLENSMRGASYNINTGMCKNKLHEWVPENISVWKNGKQMCKPCDRAAGARKRLRRAGEVSANND